MDAKLTDLNEQPLITIGMPVRNCEDTLPIAIRSLILQTYRHWELLIIDDGSTDQTLAVSRDFTDPRIKVYADGNWVGLAARLNQAISLACGKYFARMDGDDVAYPERLECQVRYLEEHSEVDLVGALVVVFRSHGVLLGKRTGPEKSSSICAKPHAGFPMVHPTFVGRLEWFRRHRYKEEIVGALHEDQELLLRSYRFSKFANVPEILLGYREERLDLKKMLRGRWYFLRAAIREFRQHQETLSAARTIFAQTSKALLDCTAVFSGLGYRLLRHRAQPLTKSEQQEWEKVWKLANFS